MKLVETIAKYEGIELREFCSRSENLNPPLSPAFSARTALGLPDRHNGHCTLGFRGDPIVLGSDQVPARLGSPRRFANCAAETRYTPWHLGVDPERGFFLGPRQPRKRRQTWLCRGTKSRLAVAAWVIRARPAAGL